VACVESEVCNCVVFGFVFVIFPCGFDVLPLVEKASWENFCCVLYFTSFIVLLFTMCMSIKYKCKCHHTNDRSCFVFLSLPKLGKPLFCFF
jgi:hypothetical protein